MSVVDLFELWRIRALSMAREVGVAPEAVNEAIAVVRHAFGDEWLAEITARRTLGTPYPFRDHPIGGMITTAGMVQVVELLELSEYLKFAAASPEYPAIVANLKAQYGKTIPQLAFAYRFRQGGADNVTLEPPAADGRSADVGFEYGGREYMVECFVPSGSSGPRDSYEQVQWLTQQVMEAVSDLETPVSVAVVLREPMDAADRKDLVRLIRKASMEVQGPIGRAGYTPLTFESPVAHISVGATVRVGPDEQSQFNVPAGFVDLDEQPDVFVRSQLANRSEVFRAQNQVIRGSYGSHIAVWRSEEERAVTSLDGPVGEPLRRLAKKVKDKVPQTKAGTGARGVLIVQTWLAEATERATAEEMAEFERQTIEQHSGLDAVVLILRHWSEEHRRFVYHSRIVASSSAAPDFCDWLETVCSAAEITGVPAIER